MLLYRFGDVGVEEWIAVEIGKIYEAAQINNHSYHRIAVRDADTIQNSDISFFV